MAVWPVEHRLDLANGDLPERLSSVATVWWGLRKRARGETTLWPVTVGVGGGPALTTKYIGSGSSREL